MAAEIIPGCIPAPSVEPFAAQLYESLAGPRPVIDPTAQAQACRERARVCLRAARAARADGTQSQTVTWLKSARMLRLAASVWRERAQAATRQGLAADL
jgi:hypothetical protein